MGWSDEFRFRDCPWCGLRDADMREHGDAFGVGLANGSARYYGIVSCPRCAGIVVVEVNALGHQPHQLVSVSPEGDTHAAVLGLPDDVAQYYGDAIRVLEAGVPDAAAVQLRRTLEAAAAHFGVREPALVRSIQKLIDDGLVTKRFGHVLHHIRVVGNVGAHASDARVDGETAERALRFTTQVLRNLFEVPAELEAINQSAPAEPANATAAAHDASVATGPSA